VHKRVDFLLLSKLYSIFIFCPGANPFTVGQFSVKKKKNEGKAKGKQNTLSLLQSIGK
jgi:hypothetical protein